MTQEGWRELVLIAVAQDAEGDAGSMVLLVRLLAEQDQAKQILRDKGYGWLGMGWLETVNAIPDRKRNDGNIFVFCDYVDEKRRGCVRGAGHSGPHAVTLPPYPQSPVILRDS